MLDSEDRIQADIVRWYTNTHCLRIHTPRMLIMSVPNGGNRDAREAMTMKTTGLLAGASDLIVLHGSTLLWVEIKTPTGRQSSAQIEFEQRVTALGYTYKIIKSLQGFINLINAL